MKARPSVSSVASMRSSALTLCTMARPCQKKKPLLFWQVSGIQ